MGWEGKGREGKGKKRGLGFHLVRGGGKISVLMMVMEVCNHADFCCCTYLLACLRACARAYILGGFGKLGSDFIFDLFITLLFFVFFCFFCFFSPQLHAHASWYSCFIVSVVVVLSERTIYSISLGGKGIEDLEIEGKVRGRGGGMGRKEGGIIGGRDYRREGL